MKDGVTYNRKYKKWRVCVMTPNLIYVGYCVTKTAAMALYTLFHKEGA